MNYTSLQRQKSFAIGPFELKYDVFIITILLLFGIFLFSQTSYLPLWDEGDLARAAGQAINDSILFLGSGFKPLFVASISIAYLIFGISTQVAIGVASLFGLLTMYFLYLFVDKLTKNNFIAASSALLFALTPYFLYYARISRPDTMAAFFICFILWAFLTVRDKLSKPVAFAIIGILIGIGSWIRTTVVMVAAIIIVYEAILWLKQQLSFKKFIYRSLLIAIPAIIIYVSTILLYSALEPNQQIDQEGGYTAGDYNQKTANSVFDLITHPFRDLNIVFYPLALWHLTSSLFIILLCIGLFILTIKTIREPKVDLGLVAFVFMLVFLSFFPHHRFKIFFIAIPFAAYIATSGLSLITSSKIRSWLLVIIVLAMVVPFTQTYSYDASAPYEAISIAMNEQPVGLLNSNQGVYLFHAMYDNDADYYLPRDQVTWLQSISSIEELQEFYNRGYTVMIVDHRGYDLPYLDIIKQTTPFAEVENDVWLNDPIIEGNYLQVPFLKEADYNYREDWITLRSRDDPYFNTIKIYKTNDILETAQRLNE